MILLCLLDATSLTLRIRERFHNGKRSFELSLSLPELRIDQFWRTDSDSFRQRVSPSFVFPLQSLINSADL
jgi:hypothetical protein